MEQLVKICTKCKKEKPIDVFSWRSGRKKRQSWCKVCTQENTCLYYKKYPEKKKESSDKYYKNNKEVIKLKERRRYSKHPEVKQKYVTRHRRKISKRTKQYNNTRRQTDITFRLRGNLRSRLSVYLKRGYKSGSSIRDLECSIEYLKQYIESKFHFNPKTGEPMTWNSWGKGKDKWQIHHIKSLAEFDLANREQFLIACNYANLEPLWYSEHWEKHRKY